MFRAVPMMHLQVVVLAQDERPVLKGLGRLGAVQLTSTPSGPDTAPMDPSDGTMELARYGSIRARVKELRQSLEILPVSRGPEPAEITPEEAEEKINAMERSSSDLLGHRRELVQRRKELAALCERISCYRGLEIPLDGLDRYSFLHFVTGSLPEQNLEGLEKDVGDNTLLIPLARQKGQQSLFAVTTRGGRADLEQALQRAGFQDEMLPVAEGTTVDRLSEKSRKEQDQLEAELEEVNGRLREIAAEFTIPLDEIDRSAEMECRLLEASGKFPRTEASVLISGWVPAGDVAVLEQHIAEITAGRYALQSTIPDASSERQVPVLLRNSFLLRPFEMLVSTYDLPNYRELEPTLFVALSYILMFGMMFGDAGHGLVLAVFGLIALIAGRSGKAREFGILLLSGGISSIVFGIVYGSYFGIEAFKKYAIWHDPLEGDPMKLMYGAIGLGIVMISLGLIFNIINRFRQGDLIGGILDKFGLVGLLFYWGALVFLMNVESIRSQGLMGVSVVVFFVVPIVGWSLKEPIEYFHKRGSGENGEGSGGLIGAIMESCVGAFEAVLSYLANTISFVRLAAYAMSHAALLLAAFMLAEAVREIPYGGGFLSLLVAIGGNIVAIVLEGIIASVQALRLEYYEFFGKFFSGGGKPFEPFILAVDRKDPVS